MTVIDAEARPLAIPGPEPPPQVGLALFTGEPDEVIMRAVKVADALKSVITQKGLVKKIQGREFIEIAGWQTLGSLVGVTTSCEWTRRVEDPNGWEARVVVLRNGVQVGAAEAQCTRDEKSWSNRDEYALRSMSQTRACSKALRSVLGFIAVIAGYEDTPASEVPAGGFDNAPRKAPTVARMDDTETRDRKALLRAIHTAQGAKGIDVESYRELVYAIGGDPSLAIDPKDGKERPTARNLSVEDLKRLLAAVEAA